MLHVITVVFVTFLYQVPVSDSCMCVCFNIIQTLKNLLWNRRRLLYLLLAGILLLLIYLLSNFGSNRDVQRHHRQHEDFLRVVQESKRTREELMQKPFITRYFHHTVVLVTCCRVYILSLSTVSLSRGHLQLCQMQSIHQLTMTFNPFTANPVKALHFAILV